MAMQTRTEEVGTYGGMQEIATMEDNGWAVRQVIPIVEEYMHPQTNVPDSVGFTTKVWVVYERERESGWVQTNVAN